MSMLSSFAKKLQNTLYINLASVRPKRADNLSENWCALCHQSSVEEEMSLWHPQVALQCLEMLWNDKSNQIITSCCPLSVIFLKFQDRQLQFSPQPMLIFNPNNVTKDSLCAFQLHYHKTFRF